MNSDNKGKPNKPIIPADEEEWQKESLDSKFGSEIFHPPANPGTFKPMEEGGKIVEKHHHKKKKKKSKESKKNSKMKSPESNGFNIAVGRITIESSDSKTSLESNKKRPSLIGATKSKDSKKKKKKKQKSKSPGVHKSSSVGPNASKDSETSPNQKHKKKSRHSSGSAFSSLSRSKSTESANKRKIHVKVTTPADSKPYGGSTKSASDDEGHKKKSRSNVSHPTGYVSQSKSQDSQLITKKSNKSSGDEKKTPLIDVKPYGGNGGGSSSQSDNSQDSPTRKGIKSASEYRFTISSKPSNSGNSSAATGSKSKEVPSGSKTQSSVYYNQKNPLHVTPKHNGPTSEGSSSYLITATISKDFEHKKSGKHSSGQLAVGKISTSGEKYASKESPESDHQGPEKKKKHSSRSESFEKPSLVVHGDKSKVLYTEKLIKSLEVFLPSKTARSSEFNAPKKCSHSKATQQGKNNCPTFSSPSPNSSSLTWIKSTGEENKKGNKSSGRLSGSKSEESQTNAKTGSSIGNHPKVDTFQPFGPRASEGTVGDSVSSLMPKLPPYMSDSETGTHLSLEHPYGHSPSGTFDATRSVISAVKNSNPPTCKIDGEPKVANSKIVSSVSKAKLDPFIGKSSVAQPKGN